MTEQFTTAGIADGPVGSKLSPAAVGYAESRGISRATLERLGVASGTTFFPRRLKRRSEAVFFPFFLDGQRVNYKAAAFPEKDFIGEKGGRLCFFNLANVLTGSMETVYITEGEWDAAALIEAGIPIDRVLSVPNGASDKADEDDIKGYGYVDEALAMGLNKAQRFVYCGDSDKAGNVLRSIIVKLMGAAKLWFVDWPEGCKDANDMLRTDGPDALMDLVVHGALPWPVDGLYRLHEVPEPAPMTLWDPGFPEWEGKLKLAPGTMSVTTGHPGHGKTALWAQIWFQVLHRYGVGACIGSFETKVKPHHRRTIRTLMTGKLEKDLDHDEKRKVDAWIDAHYLWAIHPTKQPTLEWMLDMAEVAVVRHGCKVLQIDPFNRLESTRPSGESETDYIGRCLTALYVFAEDMNCHVQVLAHPAKMDQRRKSEPPLLDDISGSKHWDNRVDQGFVVHRPKMVEQGKRCTEAVLYHRKSRFEELGYPCVLKLDFNLSKGRYESADYETI